MTPLLLIEYCTALGVGLVPIGAGVIIVRLIYLGLLGWMSEPKNRSD